jgi:hypothetical protein
MKHELKSTNLSAFKRSQITSAMFEMKQRRQFNLSETVKHDFDVMKVNKSNITSLSRCNYQLMMMIQATKRQASTCTR